jgi:hypothetical protein
MNAQSGQMNRYVNEMVVLVNGKGDGVSWGNHGDSHGKGREEAGVGDSERKSGSGTVQSIPLSPGKGNGPKSKKVNPEEVIPLDQDAPKRF